MSNDPRIAATIQSQLGFALRMLGAHTLIDHGNALSFKIKGAKKVNYIKISLEPADTYWVEFKKLGRVTSANPVKDVADFMGVHAGSMHNLIEAQTGLCTRL